MKRVLITGGAGYLGSIMVPYFLEQGYAVTVLDNLQYRQNSLMNVCINPNFNFVRGDARDERLISELLKDHDIIIPLAALVGAPLCKQDPWTTESLNRDAVIMVNKLRSKDQKLLLPITNSGYGIGEKGKFCTEESPLRPISLYGTTKVEAEASVLEKGNAISFRLATVFGAGARMRTDLLVNDFVYRAVNDKAVILFEADFKRNYIHIRDVARVFLHGIENYESMKGLPYNVGLSDANLSKRELCEKIQKYVPDFVYLESEIGQDPDKRDYIVSNERIESTGWKPVYSLDDGIEELLKAYRIIKNNQYGNV
ncbi:NAD(P)-dependent oxidoreductase [Lentisphaera marina]|uniref:NAD-dependent epimerase/dehydratase family protein n=1 Tax=Lentisphaera marina TaxID=1111041 RepID=UPI002366F1A4|nr:NAD(P)-dependent oxidoreductase [Lentisphaera marina]MDD7985736.1 NAD(P)-dependent oxidoreductase [Lentisphaera marina]